jgi:hypothetical protein
LTQNTITTVATPVIPASTSLLDADLKNILQIATNRITPMTNAHKKDTVDISNRMLFMVHNSISFNKEGGNMMALCAALR